MISKSGQEVNTSLVKKVSTSPLTSGNLFNYTGSVEIIEIIGRVTTAIQAQATTVKLSITPDALAAKDICATLDINGFAAGSALGITGTLTDAMTGTTGVGVLEGQGKAVKATCVTSGTITVTFGAVSTGAIEWEILWIPLNSSGLITAA